VQVPKEKQRLFMYLAYLDDSDTKSKRRKWQVMAGVLIEDRYFKLTESGMSFAQ